MTAGPRVEDVAPAPRVTWLNGVRAAAALFVVLHHVWLMSYGGFPDNGGPTWTQPLVFGHLAVAVFIVVSGYSLTVAPTRRGLTLREGGWGFVRRRFWRIVPPYWVALALSALVVTVGLIQAPDGGGISGRDVGVHALLLQDTVANTPPNGVFWSIAVEWHIYFFFPLLLLLFRRFRIGATCVIAAVCVVGLHQLGLVWSPAAAFDRFTPQFFVLFVLGMAAAALPRRAIVGRTAAGTAVVGVVALGVVFVVAAPRAVVGQYFWVDLAVGATTAALFVAMTGARLTWLTSVLSASWLVAVGEFAFSLYLVHGPLLETIRVHVVQPAGWTDGAAFLALLVIGVPVSLLGAYLFFLVFERPFLTIRSWSQLRAALHGAAVGLRPRRMRNLAVEELDKEPVSP